MQTHQNTTKLEWLTNNKKNRAKTMTRDWWGIAYSLRSHNKSNILCPKAKINEERTQNLKKIWVKLQLQLETSIFMSP